MTRNSVSLINIFLRPIAFDITLGMHERLLLTITFNSLTTKVCENYTTQVCVYDLGDV
jgi:hypothetical protein